VVIECQSQSDKAREQRTLGLGLLTTLKEAALTPRTGRLFEIRDSLSNIWLRGPAAVNTDGALRVAV